MVKIPSISGKKLLDVLIKGGFSVVNQKGSHVSIQKGKYRSVVLLHKDLAKGTILAILKQCGLSKDDFMNLLKM